MKIAHKRLEYKNHTLINDQKSWKTILFGVTHTHRADIKEYPPSLPCRHGMVIVGCSFPGGVGWWVQGRGLVEITVGPIHSSSVTDCLKGKLYN